MYRINENAIRSVREIHLSNELNFKQQQKKIRKRKKHPTKRGSTVRSVNQ